MSFCAEINRTIKVKDKLIGPGQPIFLTAEIGLSHMGNFDDAKAMLKAAAEAGCDGADCFMASGEDFYHAPFGPGNKNDSRKVWAEQSFNDEQWKELFGLADDLGIVLYITPLDSVSLKRAGELGTPMININSDDTNNPLHLELAASLGIPITMHDINASLSEVEMAVRVLLDNGCKDLVLLHSTQESGEEETLYASANLRVMETYRNAFGGLGVMAGTVEHTTSDFLIYAVAALSPVLISKHIQVSKDKNIHDSNISVDIDKLNEMVKKVRYVEMALGSGHNQKVVGADGKLAHGAIARKKVLVAARDIPKGKRIDREDIVAKRPGHLGGLHPSMAMTILGAVAAEDIAYNQILSLNHFADFAEVPYKFPDIDEVKVRNVDNIQGA